MKNRANHARKNKRKQLRKEATRRRIWLNKADKLLKAGKESEVSQKAVDALRLQAKVIQFETLRRYSRMDKNPFNQRQKRKRWRQSPHLRRKAA